MLAYENMVSNKTGTFPNTQAKNASSAGGTDGTEYVAAILNDIWGFWQQLITMAGMTPNGTSEAAQASTAATTQLGVGQQKAQAMQMVFGGAPGEAVFDFIAPGTGTYGSQAMSWGSATGGPPSRYQYRRVIACAGQFVPATIPLGGYPDLAAAIYCGDANNATATYCYYTSDAGGTTRSTVSKNYIKLPDMRGVTIRGYDHGGIHDPLGATRGSFGEIASLQQDAMQGHIHSVGGSVSPGSGNPSILLNTGLDAGVQRITTPPGLDGTNGTPRTSSETRMYNVSVNAGIRY